MTELLKGLNIFLVGMMGTGKTTIGKLLARQLEYRFFDTDELIEQVAKRTVNDIFDSEGETGFRELESKVLGELCAYTRSAIATGGGIVLRRENWSYLHHGLIVWLDAPVDVLLERLAGDTSRPLLQTTDPALKLTTLLNQRRSLYAQADLHVHLDARQTPEQTVLQIIEMIPGVLKPNQSTPNGSAQTTN